MMSSPTKDQVTRLIYGGLIDATTSLPISSQMMKIGKRTDAEESNKSLVPTCQSISGVSHTCIAIVSYAVCYHMQILCAVLLVQNASLG